MSIKTPPIIEVSNVDYSYDGKHKILEHISFTIDKGSYVGIIGPNGGGKTTLLKILLGLIPLQSGKVKINDENISKMKKRYEVGYIPQRISQENINFPATVYEIVESGRTPRMGFFTRLDDVDKEAITKALKIAHIESLKNKIIFDLSGGERQRVFVARALASEPQILLLDEPFVGVDIIAQEEFYFFLKELNKKQNLTIIFVSHDIDIITQEATEILCLNKRLVCSGKAATILEEPMIEQLYGKKVTHIHHEH